MSLLIAAVNAVVASPLPSATPQVIKEVVTNNMVPVTPENVLNLFQLLALAGAGAATSIVHLAVERGKLPSNVNRLLFTLYSAVAGVAVVVLGHQAKWDWSALLTGVTAFLAFLGSTQGQKMLSDFIAKLVIQTKVDPSGAVVPSLATEDPSDSPA